MSDYCRWKRKPDVGPGHAMIWVMCDERGVPCVENEGYVQCATMDRIPFAMRPQKLTDHYEKVS